MIETCESIDGIRIPDAYRLAGEEEPRQHRFFKDRQNNLCGPFVFDAANVAFRQFSERMSHDTRTLQMLLAQAMQKRQLPFECRKKLSLEKLMASERRLVKIFLRPPLFVSKDAEEKRSGNRFVPPHGTSAVFIHVDEAGTLHRTRSFDHPNERLRSILNRWAGALNLRLSDELHKEPLGNMQKCAKTCADVIEELYHLFNQQEGKGWHIPFPVCKATA